MAPADRQQARVTTPVAKESNKEGVKSPEKTRPQSSTKAPVKTSVPKRPLTTPRAPSFTASRERAKLPVSPSAAVEKKPIGGGQSPKPSTHVRTVSKPSVRRPESRLRNVQAPDKAPTSSGDTRVEAGPSNEDGEGTAAGDEDKPQISERENQRKDAEIVELKSLLEDARSESEAQENSQADHLQQLKSKSQEMGRLADYVHELETKIQSLQEKHDIEARENNQRHRQELESIRASPKQANGQEVNDEDRLAEPTRKMSEEVDFLKRTHDHELKEADTRHAQQLKKAVQQQKQQVEEALEKQRNLQEEALIHEEESKAMQSEKERNIEEAAAINKQKLDAALKVQQELQGELQQCRQQIEEDAKQSQQKLQENVSKYEAQLEDANITHRNDITQRTELHQRELNEANMNHEERFKQAFADHEKSLVEARNVQRELEDAARDQEQRLQATLSKREKDLNQRIQDLQHLREEAMGQVQQLTEAVTRLEKEKTSMAAEHDQNMKEAQAKHKASTEQELSQNQNETSELRCQLQESIQETALLKNTLEKARTDQESADENLSRKHKEGLEQSSAKHEQEVLQLNQEKSAALADNARLSTTLENILSEVEDAKKAATSKYDAELQGMKTSHAQELEKLSKESESATEEIHSLRKQSKTYEQELLDLRNKKAYAGVEVTKFKAAMTDMTVKHNASEQLALEHHEKELHDQASTHHQEMGQLRTENDKLKTKHSAEIEKQSSRHTQELQSQHSAHQREIGSLESDLSTLRDSMKELEASISAGSSRLSTEHQEQLQGLVSKHTQELESSRNENKTTFNELSQLRSQLMSTDAKHRKAISSYQQESEQAAAHHEQELAHLRSQYEVACGEAAALKAALQEADQEASKVMEDRTRLQEQNLNAIRDERDNIIEVNTATEGRNKDLVVEGAALSEEITDLRKALEGRTQEYENMINKHEDVLRDMLTSQHKTRALEEELSTAMKQTNSKFEHELQQLRTEDMQMANQFDSKQQSHDHEIQTFLTAERDAALAGLKSAKEELTMLKSQHADTSQNLHSDLRRYMSLLGRQHSTDVDDLEALRSDMTRDAAKREDDWRRHEERSASISDDLEKTIAAFA